LKYEQQVQCSYWLTFPFDPTKSWEIYTAGSGSSLVFQHFWACHTLMDTKKHVTWHSGLLQKASCLYTALCTALTWSAIV
jgi:hypothetical protein